MSLSPESSIEYTDETQSEYTPSATPESEDYTSCESSSLETPSESSASLADSDNVSQEIWSD